MGIFCIFKNIYFLYCFDVAEVFVFENLNGYRRIKLQKRILYQIGSLRNFQALAGVLFYQKDIHVLLINLLDHPEDLQDELWRLGVAYAREGSDDAQLARSRGPFLQSIIGLMDIQTARLEAAVANRIPSVIWFTLYLTGSLSMLITGYQAALVGRRSPLATVTLAVAFASVMTLITDLDRPVMRFFDIDTQVVHDLADRMDRIIAADD